MASTEHPHKKRTPVSSGHRLPHSTPARDASAALAESYVRALQGYAGADTALSAAQLVNAHWEARDRDAAQRVLEKAGKAEITANAPSPALLAALKNISRASLHGVTLAEESPEAR